MPTAVDRFWAKVQEDGDCWVWTAARDRRGYGKFSAEPKRKNTYAHRFSYEHMVSEIPPGRQIDHLCRNTSCVNPWHLEPVTPEENRRRQAAA